MQGVYTYSVFIAKLSPVYMIEANMGYLSSFADKLTFASSEANSDIIIGGNRMDEDINMENPMFGLGDISFTTGEILTIENWNADCIEVEFNGNKFVGAVKSMEYSLSNIEEVKYELIELK